MGNVADQAVDGFAVNDRVDDIADKDRGDITDHNTNISRRDVSCGKATDEITARHAGK